MADYQWRTDARTLCTGLGGSFAMTMSNQKGWTNGNAGSGSHSYTVSLANRFNIGNKGTQYFDADVKVNWTVSYDKNNRMLVTVSQSVTKINLRSYANSNVAYAAIFRNGSGSGSQIGNTFNYNLTSSGTWWNWGNNSFTWTIDPGQESPYNTLYLANFSTRYANEGNCNVYVDKGTIGVRFKNMRAWNYDAPAVNNVTCIGATTGISMTASVDYGTVRPSSGSNTYIEIAQDANFTDIVYTASKTGSGQKPTITFDATGLHPNTLYYIRYRATNGSKTSDWKYCQAVTLTTNQLSEPQSERYNLGRVRLSIQMGGNYYTDPSTKIYVRKCDTGDQWTEVASSNTTSVATVNFNGLEEQTCYDVQARTTTPAGTYSGNIVKLYTPQRDLTTAVFTKIEPAIDENTIETYADVCYKYEATMVPAKIKILYRVKNGFDKTWYETEEITVTELTGDYCTVLHDLYPNQTVYEMYIATETDGNTWEGPISEFITPLLANPNNCICDNMEYLLDLLCQAVKPLYNGNKTIYANPTTKELCDPYSENPTLATLWSRLLRFDHAAACIICDMLELLKLKGGKEGQYYVGEIGWVSLAEQIVEGSEKLVTSGSVADYISSRLDEVWHYDGEIDYLIGNRSEFPTDNIDDGAIAIETDTSKRYVWNGTDWEEDTTYVPDNFSVFGVTHDFRSSFGIVKAGQAYYHFEGHWNNINADVVALEERLDKIENAIIVEKQDANEDDIYIQLNYKNFDYNTLPTGKRVMCFVLEGNTVTFKTGTHGEAHFSVNGSNTLVQGIGIGDKITEPGIVIDDISKTLIGWVDEDGNEWDFNDVVEQDMVLTAKYRTDTHTVTIFGGREPDENLWKITDGTTTQGGLTFVGDSQAGTVTVDGTSDSLQYLFFVNNPLFYPKIGESYMLDMGSDLPADISLVAEARNSTNGDPENVRVMIQSEAYAQAHPDDYKTTDSHRMGSAYGQGTDNSVGWVGALWVDAGQTLDNVVFTPRMYRGMVQKVPLGHKATNPLCWEENGRVIDRYEDENGNVWDWNTPIDRDVTLRAVWVPLTAEEYDSLSLTADEYDAKNITATEYDKSTKEDLE